VARKRVEAALLDKRKMSLLDIGGWKRKLHFWVCTSVKEAAGTEVQRGKMEVHRHH